MNSRAKVLGACFLLLGVGALGVAAYRFSNFDSVSQVPPIEPALRLMFWGLTGCLFSVAGIGMLVQRRLARPLALGIAGGLGGLFLLVLLWLPSAWTEFLFAPAMLLTFVWLQRTGKVA